MQLWLMRHGLAVDPDLAGSDFDRKLTPAGEQQVAAVGSFLAQRTSPPELVWHSPLVRTRQTATILHAAFHLPADGLQERNSLAPGVNWAAVLEQASRTFVERMVCVGHEPDISRGVAALLGGGSFLVRPGTVVAIEFPAGILAGQGRLLWMQSPDLFG